MTGYAVPALDFEIHLTRVGSHVAVVEFERGKNNYFSAELINTLADTLEKLSIDGMTRAVVLSSSGRNFCAGAEFSAGDAAGDAGRLDVGSLYRAGARLFDQPLPVVAQLQGAVVGGGLGLALTADFRVASPETRFVANFARIGLHHGFGLSVTLPRLVGTQHANLMLYTGQPVAGEQALSWGLCEVIVPAGDLRDAAVDLASQIAESAPLAVRAIRRTMRRGLAAAAREATSQEQREQTELFGTADFAEGTRAAAERRPPVFHGQ